LAIAPAPVRADPECPGDGVHVNAGAQHTSPSGDHMAWARVADHHRVYRPRVFEVGFRAAEASGVLIHVEQQHHAACPAARGGGKPGGEVGEDDSPGLGV
jgi:hypothetical protein